MTLVALAQALVEHEAEDEELSPDQPGWLDGQVVNLHATLTNTCVIGPAVLDVGDERYLVRHAQVQVDPASLRWQPKATPLTQYWSRRAQERGRAQAKVSSATRRGKTNQSAS